MHTLTPASRGAVIPPGAKATSRTRDVLFLFSIAMLLTRGAAATRAQLVVDSFDPNADGWAHLFALEPEGRILIDSDFLLLAPNLWSEKMIGGLRQWLAKY